VSFVEYLGAFLPVSDDIGRAEKPPWPSLTKKDSLPHHMACHLYSSLWRLLERMKVGGRFPGGKFATDDGQMFFQFKRFANTLVHH
jgi:hypothetical protein